MSKPKQKRKYAACGACRRKGLVWWLNGARIAPRTVPPIGSVLRFCTCELGEAKRLAAKEAKR